MAFSVKAWLDKFGSGGNFDQPTDTGNVPDTPADAAGMRDLETRLSGYTDAREAAEISARNTAISTHTADTTAVHGITDTAALATSTSVASAVAAEATARNTAISAAISAQGDLATQTELDAHVNDTTAAHAASAISVNPSGAMGSTDVQSALVEAFSELSGGSVATTVIDLGGNLGSTETIDTDGDSIVARNATLDQATCTITINDLPAGEYRFVKIIGVKGAAGDEALLIDDGSGAVEVPTPEGAGAPFEVILDWDGTDSQVYLAGGSVAPGADETVNTVAATGATETLPVPSTASVNDLTLTANCTLTFPTADEGRSFSLILRQDGTGSRTVTWPGTVKWAGGVAPTLSTAASAIDVLTFLCVDGTNWLGFVAGQAFA